MESGASWGCSVGLALLIGLGMLLAAEVEGPPPLTYSAKPVQGILVDAQTGEPLMGVIVVAQWIMHEPGKGSWRRLHVFETTTDSRGNYLIPGWGPKRNTWYPWTRLRDADPTLNFFKPGYVPLGVRNRWERNESGRFSEWDRKMIKLQKFTGTDEDWIRELSFVQTSLSWGSEVTEWRSMPRIVLALEQERGRIPHKLLDRLGGLEELGTTAEEIRRFLEEQK